MAGLQLNENLRDRLVAGVNNEKIQQRLLQNPGLSLQKALTTCLAMEIAAKNVCWLKNETFNLCGKTGHIKPVC